jgi:type I site-specific restriction-modification system R (restriction) subunit
MYLDTPMRDHVLLQAIARLNSPYEDSKGKKKPRGLIIDFVGVLKETNKALALRRRRCCRGHEARPSDGSSIDP